jgi:hypothetical protein
MDTRKLLQQLEAVPLGKLYQASFKAQMRLQIYFTSLTHEMLLDFGREATALILKAGGRDGVLDGASGFALQTDLLRAWGDMFKEWQAQFLKARREAAWIPFGVLAVMHERVIRPVVSDQSSVVSEALTETVKDGVFSPQIRILLDVAENYLYGGSSLNLSSRIWNLDRETRDGINQVLMQAIANGSSAWDTAKLLEQFLGANADCPRWTSTRLYGMTAKEKTTSTTGLLSGDACDERGVSYNALRLARTEIQKIHSLATDKVMAMQPWVEQEKIHLSAAHPERDECDDIVEGGENGDGVYPKGEIELPIHPHCFCFKTAVLMDQKEFISQLRGWMTGEQAWPEMDQYAQDIGGNVEASILPQAIGLAVWLLGTELSEWLK